MNTIKQKAHVWLFYLLASIGCYTHWQFAEAVLNSEIENTAN